MEDRKDAPRRMKARIKLPEYHLHVWLGVIQINKASVSKSKMKKTTKQTTKFFSVEIFYFSLQGKSEFVLLCNSDLFCNSKLKFAECLNAGFSFIAPRWGLGMTP